MNPNLFLSIKDILKEKLYFTLLIVFLLSTFIMIVPQNLSDTHFIKEFIRYMEAVKRYQTGYETKFNNV